MFTTTSSNWTLESNFLLYFSWRNSADIFSFFLLTISLTGKVLPIVHVYIYNDTYNILTI